MGGGAVALNIAQEWLAKLSSAALTQASLIIAYWNTVSCAYAPNTLLAAVEQAASKRMV